MCSKGSPCSAHKSYLFLQERLASESIERRAVEAVNRTLLRRRFPTLVHIGDHHMGAAGMQPPCGRLAKARRAVPVWIMPLSRVYESFDPRDTKFDVFIIDEASQSDVTALALPMDDRLVQLFAQLSIIEGEGVAPGRFEP